jgi:cholesterol oxidase
LVAELCESGREAWVLDLRTSAGLATATYPWTFEEVARGDIRPAIKHVLRETGQPQLDVIAHCIGAVMFSMAILGEDPALSPPLNDKIRKAVLLNKGPVLRYTSANVLRAFVWRYYREFFNVKEYSFKDRDEPSLAMSLLDRLLSTLPYPKGEYHLENPSIWQATKRTPFTKTRHRIDFLYGRSFSLRNISDEVLEHIDDFFGPLNIDTLTQTLHFAARNVITTHDGKNDFVEIAKLKKYWTFSTLFIGAEENGLADPTTLTLIDEIMGRDALLPVRTLCLPNVGHQDALIGKSASNTFKHILDHLDSATSPITPGSKLAIGPMHTRVADRQYYVESSQLPLQEWSTKGATHYALLLIYSDPSSLGKDGDAIDPARSPDDLPSIDNDQPPPAIFSAPSNSSETGSSQTGRIHNENTAYLQPAIQFVRAHNPRPLGRN